MLQTFCFQELHDDTGMDNARLARKLLHIEEISPFFLMTLYLISTTTVVQQPNYLIILERSRSNGSHLESLDAPGLGRWIFKKCALARCWPNGDKI